MSASAIWEAWSCRVRVTVAHPEHLTEARRLLEGLMDDVSSAADRFSAQSDISAINRHAGSMVSVGPRTMAILDTALDAAAETGGLVDPTVGLHVIGAGYTGDIESIRGRLLPDSRPRLARLPQPANWTSVRMDHQTRLVGIPDGIALDLGATAKSLTADMAAAQISATLGTPVLVELGGDLSVAGRRPQGWTIAVSESSPGPRQQVTIGRGGVATSSTTARRWRTSAGEQHHIIDPRTGLPAVGPWRTVTVWSDTATKANIASTAVIILGHEGEAYLNELGLSARLVSTSGQIVTTGAWPAHRRAA